MGERLMKRLIERQDKQIREELGDYYIVSKVRLENIINCFEKSAERIKELTTQVAEQQEEILHLVQQLTENSDD